MPSDADLIAAGAKRVERIGPATLILGDCREIAPRLPRPDAIVSDPPYGIGFAHGGGGGKLARSTQFAHQSIIGDDTPFDPSMWLEAPRVVLWGANHYADRLPARAQWLTWDKRDGVCSNDQADCEHAWTNGTGPARICRHLWNGMLKATEKGEVRVHPTQKPVAVMEWCIEQMRVAPGALCLDPYMGSGTTGVACIRRGVRFVGIEIEPRYFDTACRRIAEAARQPSLFDAPKPQPVQTSLIYPVESMA